MKRNPENLHNRVMTNRVLLVALAVLMAVLVGQNVRRQADLDAAANQAYRVRINAESDALLHDIGAR